MSETTLRKAATTRRAFVRGLAGIGIGLGVGMPFRAARSNTLVDLAGNARLTEPIVGVEFGTSKFRAAVGEQMADGLIKILAIAEARYRDGKEPARLTKALHQLCTALYAAQEASDVMIRRVHLAVLGPRSIANTNISLLKMLAVEAGDVAFAAIPCAMAVLSSGEKERGALMIDLGAMQTGHVAYLNGKIMDYGSHQRGSAHVTEDLATQLQVPWARAETLKIENGDALTGPLAGADPTQRIIYLRLRAILEKTRERLISNGVRLNDLRTGVHLTGGGSRQRGIVELVSELFGLPACLARAKGVMWNDGFAEGPEHSCAVGLLSLCASPLEEDSTFRRPSVRRYFGIVPTEPLAP